MLRLNVKSKVLKAECVHRVWIAVRHWGLVNANANENENKNKNNKSVKCVHCVHCCETALGSDLCRLSADGDSRDRPFSSL